MTNVISCRYELNCPATVMLDSLGVRVQVAREAFEFILALTDVEKSGANAYALSFTPFEVKTIRFIRSTYEKSMPHPR